MPDERLTDESFWDDYWEGLQLPQEVRRSESSSAVNAILDVFERYLPRGPGLTALEIGGAPGGWLAYVHRTFGYEIHCLDSSPVGCDKTRENFALLGLPVHVHPVDLFDDAVTLPPFDVVFSGGLIEHFADLDRIVERHLRFLRPGGHLLLICPNFRGVYCGCMRRLAPTFLARHNLDVMDARRWDGFERRFGLERLFRGYVGGLEPGRLHRCERRTLGNRILRRGAMSLARFLARHARFQRRWNTRYTSAFLVGVYRRPDSPPS